MAAAKSRSVKLKNEILHSPKAAYWNQQSLLNVTETGIQ